MSMPRSYDPDGGFRLLFDEVDKIYRIQEKRLIFGWKFLCYRYRELYKAQAKIDMLRREKRKYKIKKQYVVLDY